MNVQQNSTPAGTGRVAGCVALFTVALCGALIFALTRDGSARPADAVNVEIKPASPIQVALADEKPKLAAPAAGTGNVVGTITFDGAAPKVDLIVKKGDPTVKDPAVCAAADIPSEALVVDPDTKGIANVFIYLAKAPDGAKVPDPAEKQVVFDQMGCRFLPHGLIVQTGQMVLVKSGDPIPHNTHTFPLRNPGFNQAIAANDRKGVELKYTKPEKLPLEVKCDYHTWMKAYHLVLDHPYMAVTDKDGKFAIANVPAGKHEFVIWQEKAGYLNRKQAVEVKGGGTAEVKLSFGAAKFAAFEGPKPKTLAINVVPE